MPSYQIYQILTQLSWAFFAFAFGACVGSLINVIAYRLPLGLNIVTPPSRCPACETRLTFRENIPIFGWIFLKGRCRFCKSKISAEYPIVEAIVAFLFLLLFAQWYMLPPDAHWLGMNIGELRPRWTLVDAREAWPRHTWPTFLVILALAGSLVAMTIVDAKTFTIPLTLPWFATIVAVVGHTGHALWAQQSGRAVQSLTAKMPWFLPTPIDWPAVLAPIGGAAGLGVGILLMRLGLIRRSFADYEAWEKQAVAEYQLAHPESPDPPAGVATEDAPAGTPDMWIQYPHARREMFKEVVFLAPCVLLGYLAWHLGSSMTTNPPLALQVFSGTLLGYLVGGGVVWLVRIVGSFSFGKEAMGLGDVHLMAAVGAAMGWVDSILGFFGAAFVGLGWAILARIVAGKTPRALPYGPFLAVSTLLVLIFKPWLSILLQRFGFPPIP